MQNTSPLRKAKKENARWFYSSFTTQITKCDSSKRKLFFVHFPATMLRNHYRTVPLFTMESLNCKSRPQYIRMTLNDKFTNSYGDIQVIY